MKKCEEVAREIVTDGLESETSDGQKRKIAAIIRADREALLRRVEKISGKLSINYNGFENNMYVTIKAEELRVKEGFILIDPAMFAAVKKEVCGE